MLFTFNWLIALPLHEQGFHLNKQEFRDALCLRYGWQLGNTYSRSLFLWKCINSNSDRAMINFVDMVA